jgi:ribose transport system substrate-binding protein
MSRSGSLACTLAVGIAFVIAACGDDDDAGGGSGGGDSAVVAEAQEGLKALETSVLSTGPNGEKPTPADEIELSDEELQEIEAKDATAAIVLHYGGNDWSNAQVDGLEEQFAEMGIEVVAVTDADFKPETQVSDIETVLAKKPDIIVSIPTDPVATESAYRQAADQGVKLVFMDNVPDGFAAGNDYVSVVSADNYGNGVAAAHLMAEQLGGEGEIGVVFHEADFFVTQQRYDGFKATIAEQYPDIEIVEEQGIAGPDFAGDAEEVASAMLTQNPDLDGIWAVWDVPAEGVLAAARNNGRDDLAVTTIDLGENVAIDLAQGGVIKGLGAQRPFDQGVTEAMLAGYALIGKKAPPYVAVNSLPVTAENLESAWETVYREGLPSNVVEAQG